MKAVPFTLTELIRHDKFIDWVLNPDTIQDRYWHDYQVQFPESTGLIASAREYVLLLAVDTGRHKPSAEQSSKMWEVVKGKMK
ncbi:hypothetical protein [Dyadobacter jejuensis]|nr:hypothetical protein [Dyadobacter jejuensis]